MRYFLLLSYNGSGLHGWQVQPNAPTVQEFLDRSLTTLLGEKVTTTGAGRTDTGVNAKMYVAHFDLNTTISDTEYQKLIYKLNATLPKEISVKDIAKVSDNNHARFDAVSRTYKYFIHFGKDPFLENFSHRVYSIPNIDKMNQACNYLIGKKDYTSMAKLHSETNSNICNVYDAKWEFNPETFQFIFTIKSDRFLRNMVRAIVGSLLEVGEGKREIFWIEELLKEMNRSSAGESVPAKALFLWDINYPYEIFETLKSKI